MSLIKFVSLIIIVSFTEYYQCTYAMLATRLVQHDESNKKRKLAEEQINKLAQLKGIDRDQLHAGDSWKRIQENLSQMTLQELQILNQQLEAKIFITHFPSKRLDESRETFEDLSEEKGGEEVQNIIDNTMGTTWQKEMLKIPNDIAHIIESRAFEINVSTRDKQGNPTNFPSLENSSAKDLVERKIILDKLDQKAEELIVQWKVLFLRLLRTRDLPFLKMIDKISESIIGKSWSRMSKIAYIVYMIEQKEFEEKIYPLLIVCSQKKIDSLLKIIERKIKEIPGRKRIERIYTIHEKIKESGSQMSQYTLDLLIDAATEQHSPALKIFNFTEHQNKVWNEIKVTDNDMRNLLENINRWSGTLHNLTQDDSYDIIIPPKYTDTKKSISSIKSMIDTMPDFLKKLIANRPCCIGFSSHPYASKLLSDCPRIVSGFFASIAFGGILYMLLQIRKSMLLSILGLALVAANFYNFDYSLHVIEKYSHFFVNYLTGNKTIKTTFEKLPEKLEELEKLL